MKLRPHYIQLDSIGSTELGYISVAEYQKEVPFEIKRVYWTYNTPHQVTRGHHAHKCLEQCIFAITGTIKLELINQNGERFNFTLSSPSQGLYIPPLHWRTIEFSQKAVLLCLASDVYVKNDYLRNFDEFLID